MNTMKNELSLASLIERGGIYYNVAGTDPKKLLAGAIDLLPSIPALDPRHLLREIIERENLMSTGIGKGIALPHPRSPIIDKDPLVALIFPDKMIDWNTPDGSMVHTVFLLVSSSSKQHLNALSKINFLCQQEKFFSLIKERSAQDVILSAIREAETTWSRSIV